MAAGLRFTSHAPAQRSEKLASVAIMVLIVTVSHQTFFLRYFYLYLKAVYICKYEQKVDIILGAVQFLMLAGVSGCVCVCMREISDYLSSVCGSVPFESFITQKQHFQHLLLYANVSQSKCLNMFVCEQRWAV